MKNFFKTRNLSQLTVNNYEFIQILITITQNVKSRVIYYLNLLLRNTLRELHIHTKYLKDTTNRLLALIRGNTHQSLNTNAIPYTFPLESNSKNGTQTCNTQPTDLTLITCDVCKHTFKHLQEVEIDEVTQLIPLFPPINTITILSPYGSKYDSSKRRDYHICDNCMTQQITINNLLNA